MPDILPRRRMLVASAITLPSLLVATGCRSSDAFTGPDPLAGRPPLSHDVITLQAVIAAEENLVNLYKTAINADSAATATARSSVLRSLFAQHQAHLAQLKARLVVPSGAGPSSRSPSGSSPGASTAPPRVTTARLRAAEHASATDLVRRLATVPPTLAQLFASIAASDATHVIALGG